jgi:hypothetical protein
MDAILRQPDSSPSIINSSIKINAEVIFQLLLFFQATAFQ